MVKFELQKTEWDCGIAAVRALLALAGVKAGYKLIKSVAKSGPSGTDSSGMYAVMEYFKVDFRVCQSGEKLDILTALDAPALACVDDFNHWIVILPPYNDKYVTFDPATGFVLYSRRQLLMRIKHKTLGSFILTLART